MNVTEETELKATKQAIDEALDALPPESLDVVRRFAEFLRQQAEAGHPVVTTPESHMPYRYPNVTTPTANLQALPHVLAEGYDGDASDDAEALYDED